MLSFELAGRFCWIILLYTNYASSQTISSRQLSSFVHASTIICRPESFQLQCPVHMHIQPVAVTIPQDVQLNSHLANSVSPSCFWAQNNVGSYNQMKSFQNTSHCLKGSALSWILHHCEGRNVCHIAKMQLQENRTECTSTDFPIRIEYQCLPDPNTALFEAICVDTYIDTKCETQLTGNDALVVLTAQLEREIIGYSRANPRPGCPPQQPEVNDDGCPTSVDVTDALRELCNGESTCSVSPNMVQRNQKQSMSCGKLHLSMTYVCVPSEWVVVKIRNNHRTEGNERNLNHRQPKATLNSATYAKDAPARDARQLVYSSAEKSSESSAFQSKTLEAGSASETMNSKKSRIQTPSELQTAILQPMFVGLGVGIAVILLGLILVALGCKHRQRSPGRKNRYLYGRSHVHNSSETCPSQCTGNTSGSHTGTDQQRIIGKPTCPGCLVHDEQRQQCSPNKLVYSDKCQYSETGSSPSAGCAFLPDGCLHHHHHNLPQHSYCTSTTLCSTPTPMNPVKNFPMQLNTNALHLNATNVQYMFGTQPDAVSPESTQIYNTDQQSMNSSGSGVGMHSSTNHVVYGPPFALPVTSVLAAIDVRGNRIETNMYAGTSALNCTSTVESSSGRGCDGGSGASEPGEAFQCGSPYSRSYHATQHNGGLAKTANYNLFNLGGTYGDDVCKTMSGEASNMYSNVPDYAIHMHHSVVGTPEYGQSTASVRSSLSNVSPKVANQTILEYKSSRYHYPTKPGPPRSKQYDILAGYSTAHVQNVGDYYNQPTLSRQPSQRSRYAPIPDEEDQVSQLSRRLETNEAGAGDGSNDDESTGSLTEPLLEPPTNFRSPVKLPQNQSQPQAGKMNDRFHSDAIMNSRPAFDKPPDLIMTRSMKAAESSEMLELPPPPIAPLQVYSCQSKTNSTAFPRQMPYIGRR
ncbi:hypothetical protein EG68_01432 [Paragonimus skrjabini miyazakii]|uniref:SUEL-type lectin domain-containing protein n=1 Tax=Paragonimus skrjabini miyazakii TaxID=59628 RepID=A0A8S9Z1V7_9TREM|nr:hypothetical protein EG68_01432 [Paragonimus skrjabini miyazakii]